MEQSYLELNRQQRDRLRRLVDDVHDSELRQVAESDWSVATLLAHLAFWDRFGLARWDAFQRTGQFPGPVDADLLNAACAAEWQALVPREAARLMLEAVEAIDAYIERLSPAVVEAARAAGRSVLLERDILGRFSTVSTGDVADPERLASVVATFIRQVAETRSVERFRGRAA